MTRYVALGDSISVGMGDPLPGGGWRGWPALLATGLPEPEVHNLAVLGAQTSDIERNQLPAALALKPQVASVVCGLNDTLRGGFDPARTGAAVGRIVKALKAQGAEVLTMRMPDPGAMLGIPQGLARPLARRMHEVNAALDARETSRSAYEKHEKAGRIFPPSTPQSGRQLLATRNHFGSLTPASTADMVRLRKVSS